MGPLAMTHAFVDDEEQFDRSPEHLVIALESGEPRGAVGAGNSEQGVHVFTQLVAACPVRLPEIWRIHRTFGALVGSAGGVDAPRQLDDRRALGTRHGDDLPRLQVAARGRPTSNIENLV